LSHETIYVSLYVQARGVLRKELAQQLRCGRTIRHARGARPKTGQGQIPDAIPISKRPPEADDRAVPGQWEGDLIDGSGNTAVATLVELRSRFVMLVKLPSKRSSDVVPAVARKIKGLPTDLTATITWDRGKEMPKHPDFKVAIGAQVYFADPYSPWQRPTNENSNKLIREYLPNSTDLSIYSQRQLDAIARKLNARPFKVLEVSAESGQVPGERDGLHPDPVSWAIHATQPTSHQDLPVAYVGIPAAGEHRSSVVARGGAERALRAL
jgi:IS30 family transposase